MYIEELQAESSKLYKSLEMQYTYIHTLNAGNKRSHHQNIVAEERF